MTADLIEDAMWRRHRRAAFGAWRAVISFASHGGWMLEGVSVPPLTRMVLGRFLTVLAVCGQILANLVQDVSDFGRYAEKNVKSLFFVEREKVKMKLSICKHLFEQKGRTTIKFHQQFDSNSKTSIQNR